MHGDLGLCQDRLCWLCAFTHIRIAVDLKFIFLRANAFTGKNPTLNRTLRRLMLPIGCVVLRYMFRKVKKERHTFFDFMFRSRTGSRESLKKRHTDSVQ